MASSDLAVGCWSREFSSDNDVKITLARIVQCAQRLIGKNGGTIEESYSAYGVVDPETGTCMCPIQLAQ